jgi:hypothetical protein
MSPKTYRVTLADLIHSEPYATNPYEGRRSGEARGTSLGSVAAQPENNSDQASHGNVSIVVEESAFILYGCPNFACFTPRMKDGICHNCGTVMDSDGAD